MPSRNEVERFLRQITIMSDDVDDHILVDRPAEFEQYIQTHGYRLWRSLEIIKSHIDPTRPLKILELGSMPYLFSAMLRRYLKQAIVTGINVQSDPLGSQKHDPATLHNVQLRMAEQEEVESFGIRLTNIERERFPFEDGTFDVVLCMEVIEHLVYSPTHMLVESHRVLKDGGSIFLSTPNAVDLRKTFLQVLNRPVGFPYSGYGLYGRHNCEFTLKELRELMEECGFLVSRAWLENIYARSGDPLRKKLLYGIHNLVTSVPIPYLRNKRQYCFLLASGMGDPVYALPESLYLFRELYPGIS